MKTLNGILYWMENGKYTIDGYDFFDTKEDLAADINWQILWTQGKAMKTDNGWVRI